MHTILDLAWQASAVALVAAHLITAHELGHYLAARSLGIPVHRFEIGFGLPLCQHTDRDGCTWRLRLLPLGGWIAFVEPDQGAPRTYAERPPAQRAFVIAAGPAANLLLAAATFALLLAIQGHTVILAVADHVTPGSAAERAGFQPGDRILTVDGQPVERFEQLRPILQASAGRTIPFMVARDGARLELHPMLDAIEAQGHIIGVLGIRSTTATYVAATPGEIARSALERTWTTVGDTGTGIAGLLRTGKGAENVVGSLGVAAIAGEAATQGWAVLLALAGILSANLALMNLLPIPALDGGQLLLCGAEAARGRPVPATLQHAANTLGVALILGLMLLTTALDLARLDPFGWAGTR